MDSPNQSGSDEDGAEHDVGYLPAVDEPRPVRRGPALPIAGRVNLQNHVAEGNRPQVPCLREYWSDPGDQTSLHPRRLLMTLFGYLLKYSPEPGRKRRRLGLKTCTELRPMVAALMEQLDNGAPHADHSQRSQGKDLYARVAICLSGCSWRTFRKQHCLWSQAVDVVRDTWALLYTRQRSHLNLGRLIDTALRHSESDMRGPDGALPSDSLADDSEEDRTATGYGFLLTFNLNVGEGDKEALQIIQTGVVGKAKWMAFSKLSCYSSVFDEAVQWANLFAKDLSFKLCNVSMECCENSADPWRVHIHIFAALDPRSLTGLENTRCRVVPFSRCRWRDIRPNIHPCVTASGRFHSGRVATAIGVLSYYVLGPKIGQVLREGNIWPISDPSVQDPRLPCVSRSHAGYTSSLEVCVPQSVFFSTQISRRTCHDRSKTWPCVSFAGLSHRHQGDLGPVEEPQRGHSGNRDGHLAIQRSRCMQCHS